MSPQRHIAQIFLCSSTEQIVQIVLTGFIILWQNCHKLIR